MKNQPFATRLGFALAGLASALKSERSLKVQVVAAVAVLAALVWSGAAPLWWAAAALAIGGVLAAELLNTAIEQLADRLHPEQHPAIKRVKDLAAAAVLLASLAALGVAVAFVWELATR